MKKGSNIFVPVIVLLVCFVSRPCLSATHPGSSNRAEQLPSNVLQKERGTRLTDLPAVAREKIAEHLRRAEYEVTWCEKRLPSGKTSAYQAFNRSQDLSAYFTEQGVHILPNGKGEPAWHLAITLSAYGYDGVAMRLASPVRSDAIKPLGHRVEYRRGALTEWYVNDERGLEQGVTLNEPPASKRASPLVVEWTVSGSLLPRLEQQGAAVGFFTPDSVAVLRYSGLKAWDDTGRMLPARLALLTDGAKGSSHRITYVVDDTGASYPIVIDPVITHEKKLLPAFALIEFGHSVAMSVDTVVVGAWCDDDNGSKSGSACIFDRNHGGANNWGRVKEITPSDGEFHDFFGYSVAISGDTVVVGALNDDDGTGSAYIFDRNHGGADNWGEVTKITASDAEAGDDFGVSVAISGDTVVVGADEDDENGDNSGSVYIFGRNHGGADNWGEVTKITASDAETGDHFGFSVAISGGTVLVGAPYEDDNGLESGSAYIFGRDIAGIWDEVKKITPSYGGAYDNFGYSVAISGGTVVVGAVRGGGHFRPGSAYIFARDLGAPDDWREMTRITASDGERDDVFGYSVAISGGTVVVGAMGDDNNGTTSGSAYIFHRFAADDWREMTRITASDGEMDDRFGKSVAISGGTVVVGAFYDDGSGSAYIYDRNSPGNWDEVTKIFGSGGAEGDRFGWSVAISGDTVVVARNIDYGTGSVYIFDRNHGGADNWGDVKKITAGDAFGISVAISGNTVVVGATRDDDNGPGSGSAYIFDRNLGGADNWGEVTKITASDGTAYDSFGVSVAISGDTVVVGAHKPIFSASLGSVYIFDRNLGGADNWGEVQKITASDAEGGDWFGYSVAVSGDTVVVGAPHEDENGVESGAAYIFDRNRGGANNWGEVQKVTASDGEFNNYFGWSVAISGYTVVVGAPHHYDDLSSHLGAAYIFDRNRGGANNWGEVTMITVTEGDLFGRSAAISGDTVVVGEPYDDEGVPNDAGSAHIFDRNHGGADNWGQVKEITASDVSVLDRFGLSVAVSGDTVVVGAPFDDDKGNDSGSAYIFYSPDADGDGIPDLIDPEPAVFSNDYNDGTTFGTILDRGDRELSFVELPNPEGVRILASCGGGPDPARITASCAPPVSVELDACTEVTLTCGSAVVEVLVGPVKVLVDEDIMVTVPSGGIVTIREVAEGVFQIENSGDSGTVIVEYQGQVIELAPGATMTEVDIDMKPGSYPNSLNLKSKGVVPVAVLTTDEFDATTVDPGSVKFAGAEPIKWASEDVDHDGDDDLLFHFKTQELDLNEDSTEASLTGMTTDGLYVASTDTVNIVPRGKGKTK